MGSGSGTPPGMGGFPGIGMGGMPNFGAMGMPNTGGFGAMGIGMQTPPSFAVTRDGLNIPLMRQTGRVQGLQSRLNYIQNLAANGLVNPRFARAEIGSGARPSRR